MMHSSLIKRKHRLCKSTSFPKIGPEAVALRFDGIENIIDLRQLTLKIHSRRRLSLGIMVEFIVVLVGALVTLILVFSDSLPVRMRCHIINGY
jgi:hypothetical protein